MREWSDQPQGPRWAWVRAGGEKYAVRPDPAGGLHCVPQWPRMALDAAGRPRISLLIILSRAPLAGEESIVPLITQGRLTLVATLDIPPTGLAALEMETGATCRPAFLRRVAFSLGAPDGVLNEADGAGGGVPVPLSATLPPALVLAALRAFDGLDSGLRIGCHIEDTEAPGLDAVTLEDMLRNCGGTLDRELAIRMMVLSPVGQLAQAPRLLRGGPAPRTRGSGAPLGALLVEDRITSLPLALAAGVAVPAASLVASDATRPGGRLSASQSWYAGTDLAVTVGAGAPAPAPMPVVDDPAAPVWLDNAKPDVRWYAPRFELLQPAPNADPATAEFSFTLRPMTPTAGSGSIAPGLSAELRFTLRLATPPEATAAAAGAQLMRVPLGGLSVALEVSYRLPGQPQPLRQRFPGTVTQEGALVRVTVQLLDDWARIAYAGLAYPPAQGMEPPGLVATYAFAAAVPVADADFDLVAGGKRLEVEVLPQPQPRPDPRPVFVLSQQALVSAHATLSLAQESALRGPQPASASASASMPARSAVSAVHAVAASQSAALLSHTNTSATLRPPIIVERPPVTRPHPHIPPKRYGTRTIAREDRVEAVLPCSTLGGLYLQDEHGETNPVGCRDAFRLGEPSGKAFQELPGLRDPAFRIYRSLQQPGRFLLVPTTWRVGRYGPRAADRAYKPMMLLYAQLGDDPAADRYSLAATLVPDVGAAQLAGLRAALEPLTPAKAALDIVFPTDPFVAARVTFAWAVPESMPVPETLVVADSFTVTMAMNGPAALLVTAAIGGTGISGKADFALPDGTALNSELQLDGEVIGPAEGGPVIATRSADGVTLTNRTAQPANVFGLVCTDSTGTTREFAVGVKLDAGQARLLPDAIPDGACLVDARPAGITPIEALDLFVENISQSVLFVNQLNFANHGITALAVQARVKGAGPEQQVALAEGATLSMNFSLPVTAYLGGKSLEFALAVTKADGTQPLQWRERALAASAVIGITPDLL